MSRADRALVILCVAVLAPGCDKGASPGPFQESKAELARAYSKKLAFEAYPQFAARPSNQGKCPTIADLAEYINQRPDFTDPWGKPYVIQCGAELPPGARGIAVSSRGADGREGTADDQRSWDDDDDGRRI